MVGRLIGLICLFPYFVFAQSKVPSMSKGPSMANGQLNLEWVNSAKGYHLNKISVLNKGSWIKLSAKPSGEFSVLYAADSSSLQESRGTDKGLDFPESIYRYIIPIWKQGTSLVQMNKAGKAFGFYPDRKKETPDQLIFQKELDQFSLSSSWEFDAQHPNDLKVTLKLTAKKPGYYSIASPELALFDKNNFKWATVPGVFQGNQLNANFVNAYAYGQGIPDVPVMVRERTASTLSPLVQNSQNITLAVIPEPGTGRDPWASDTKTQGTWNLGLSVLNRKGNMMPTVYHPVLGQANSYLAKNESVSFSFRYTIMAEDWFTVMKHAANDIYQFKEVLALKKTATSLTDRVFKMTKYVTDDSLSMWQLSPYKNMEIGAQKYLGGVYGSEKDAIKNSDYGAMWMLAKLTSNQKLINNRLPYARNFKIAQQHSEKDFFYGASEGQYFLQNSKKFTEEWGPYTEPIGSTYYLMMDIGNMLLFSPDDAKLRAELKLAAEKLWSWMKPDGSWEVAYDNKTNEAMFKDILDLRPTFYGLFIAYKLLGDEKYLHAAKKGADWYIAQAINNGAFIGVCGDTRFAPDFATAQSVQALLDLYEVTKDPKYQNAAIAAAKIYTASVYTHPIPSAQEKLVNGVKRADWEISQAGLSFEHGGILGSANHHGPILLASHAGMFLRMFSITKDSLFLTMSRAAAWGRDAFVDQKTGVASYYWDAMDKGAGPFPHHAWWQIGWIMDYLISEADLRSEGQISFPRGFITPKVGPHQTYGFAAGKVYGTAASLILEQGLVKAESPYLEYVTALNADQRKCFVVLMNNSDQKLNTQVQLNPRKIPGHSVAVSKQLALIDKDGKRSLLSGNSNSLNIELAPFSLKVIELCY
ncbi:glycerophosphoryl diester phosphodiesterase [Pedobacter polysacchareus]|uniref:glycerophosphoryl diester phosphodiesterase n=1 Tax=Pedobacter polysacchareus TaxID=2861973 RepID=UPI002104507A|nr:glycerophosphoryl diester phosphodiesterase [Pedobacter polysacchareus]